MGSVTIPEKLYDIAIFIAVIIASCKYINIVIIKQIIITVAVISIILTIISIIKIIRKKIKNKNNP